MCAWITLAKCDAERVSAGYIAARMARFEHGETPPPPSPPRPTRDAPPSEQPINIIRARTKVRP
jgi:hypothetical protein